MAQPPMSIDELNRRMTVLAKYLRRGWSLNKAAAAASEELGVSERTFRRDLDRARDRAALGEPVIVPSLNEPTLEERLHNILRRKRPYTLNEIAEETGHSPEAVQGTIKNLREQGLNVVSKGNGFMVSGDVAPGSGNVVELVSDENNCFRFGALGDNHLCSKYERLDVLHALYDRYVDRGVQHVFNTGNWIDGEARFNTHDIHIHGMSPQVKYLAQNYPEREGLTTYAVAGDDHEGWYAQRHGVDIGRLAVNAMNDMGREDWVDLGYMEAYIRLVNRNSGMSATLSVMHPGGGSAYALSYAPQKIVEAFEGGEKPAVLLVGHYHKMEALNIRNVWTLQTGCTQDQTPFMRKKKLSAHVGGCMVDLEQDPKTGAIVGFTPHMWRWFNRGYYAGRWSPFGEVTRAERSP
jgi:DNA-binding Lrp family transcriptional regulator